MFGVKTLMIKISINDGGSRFSEQPSKSEIDWFHIEM